MVFKRFRLNCALRLLLVCGTIFFFFYLVFRSNLYATIFIVGLLIIIQVYFLFKYVERTNRDLTRFLQSIKYSDFTLPFTGGIKGTKFDELNSAFKEVIKAFQHTRMEKEEHFRYLQTVVQHIGIGLIAFKSNGEIELVNNAAKRLLNISHLRMISQLEAINPELANKLTKINPGEKRQLRLQIDGETLLLSIYATGFILHQQRYTLVSLQNIQSELEEKEMESWQNLIRVLTHEIMNSITPIASLASTATDLLSPKPNDLPPDQEASKDALDAVKTIQRRSTALMNFVDDYRKLTRLPKPNFEIFPIRELFLRTERLLKDQLLKESISFETSIDPETLELTADSGLIEQVLINLCKNSMEALRETTNPLIKIVAKTDGSGNPIIQVIDNGPGIKAEVVEKVFIPFFTTKKEGSGIGLSLSKQIMRLHKGTITITSTPDVETIFALRF
jgi:two-component system nitrogen regulation sensor histidine kinase NtrY